MAGRIPRRELGRLALGASAALVVAGREQRVTLAQQGPATPAQPTIQSVGELTRLAEDTYVFRSIGHQSIFIVTPEGVIATDPIGQTNPRGPGLYRAAIAAVTDQPVRYVVYSHDHQDHNEGGSVFASEAQFVAHRLAAPKIAARADSQSGRSPVPTVLLDEHLPLDLGGVHVDLHYVGRNHSDNSVVLHYPARRILFGVDFVRVNNLPSPAALRLTTPPGSWDLFLDEWVSSLDRVDALEFDLLVPGHPAPMNVSTGTKSEVQLQKQYILDSKAAYQAAVAGGTTGNEALAAALNEALAPRYGQMGGYAQSCPAMAQAWTRYFAGGA